MRKRNSSSPCKILVVDDQQSIHDAYRTILSAKSSDTELDDLEAALFDDAPVNASDSVGLDSIQFELSHALQGEQAVALQAEACSQGDPFETAFVDMRMPPGIDGLETINRLWDIDPLLQVVICTAFSDYSWSTVVERLGVTDNLLLLKKPFANEEVFQLAMAMTQKRRAVVESRFQLEQLRQVNEKLQDEICHRKTAETELQHAATHDSLTRLPNRNFLKETLSRLFSARSIDNASAKVSALIFLDVDNFKLINDSLGHAIGDDLLVEFAARLKAAMCSLGVDIPESHQEIGQEPHNLIARLGGDEFVIFLHEMDCRESTIQLAEKTRSDLLREYTVGGNDLSVGASLGIAFVNERVRTPEELMRNADLAMYRAKLSGKRCLAVFDDAMHQSVQKRLDLEASLQNVIDDGGLRLVYQPIFNVSDGSLIGLESLVRWDHPEKGVISPLDFIPVAEDTGLIIPIGRWILTEACRTIHRLNANRPPDKQIAISVNVSKRQIVDPEFVKDLTQILDSQQISAGQLNLEITESLIMDSPEGIVDRLHEIRNLGVQLHMDDFGTGHSSLACLHRFPIDVLKIDRSFVSTMQTNDDYESIIHAIITLAHNLDTTVIAEGIETEKQLEQLRQLECDFGQGFLFSRPKSIDDLGALIDAGDTIHDLFRISMPNDFIAQPSDSGI